MSLDAELAASVLTATEVAEILKCSVQHVSELRKRGVLRAIPHTGRISRFSRQAVEEFIAGKAEEAQAS